MGNLAAPVSLGGFSGEAVRVRKQHVEGEAPPGFEVMADGSEAPLERLACVEVHPHVERRDDQGELAAQAKTFECPFAKLDPVPGCTGQLVESLTGPSQHRRHRFDAYDFDARLADGERHTARSDTKLEHRAARLQGQIRVEANVVPAAAVGLIVVPSVFIVRFRSGRAPGGLSLSHLGPPSVQQARQSQHRGRRP